MRRLEVRLAFASVLLLSGSSLLSSCGSPTRESGAVKEAWNPANDPLNLAGDFTRNLAALPNRGDVAQKPWTDSYWPSYQGGLANRWNDPTHPDAFSMHVYTPAEIAQLTSDEIARLSPAEKYDLYVGNNAWTLTYYHRQVNHADDPQWFGFCHGWAPAAMNFKEPKPVTLTNPQGIQIPFGSSDVKALLTFAQQYKRSPGDTHFLGQRCNADLQAHPENANAPECRDTNAGAFHVVLTNMLGIKKQAFVADVTRDLQVWNQPVFGFTTQIINQSSNIYAGAAPGTRSIVGVKTQMSYISEFGPRWSATPFDAFPAQVGTANYEYTLELNAAGEIIGGAWQTEVRPDFLWVQTAPSFTTGLYLDKLKTIYDSSIQ